MRLDARTELVIAADIAKRLGISPQRVNVLAAAPGFPKPLGKLGRSAVWRWSSDRALGARDRSPAGGRRSRVSSRVRHRSTAHGGASAPSGGFRTPSAVVSNQQAKEDGEDGVPNRPRGARTSSSADRSSSSRRPRFRSCSRDVVELRLRHESVSRDEVHALWLGAGLATHVGLAIFEEPERFIVTAPSPVTPAAALAA